MTARPWLLVLTLVAGLSAGRPIPADAGDLLPIIACDSLVVTGATTFDFVIWTHGIAEFCRTELRPHASQFVSAEPILAWEMPEGWSAAWLPGEPGAVEIFGCTPMVSPVLRIELANPAGGIEARFFGSSGGRVATWFGSFRCTSPAVPAAFTSWGGIKATYR
jgi:hypothetical protein